MAVISDDDGDKAEGRKKKKRRRNTLSWASTINTIAPAGCTSINYHTDAKMPAPRSTSQYLISVRRFYKNIVFPK